MRMRVNLKPIAVCLAFACSQSGTQNPPPLPPGELYPTGRPATYVNPIAAENALAGDPAWRVRKGDGAPGASAAAGRPVHVEAYTDRVSLKAGETVAVMANAPDGPQPLAWTLYRLGWYGGAGARKLSEGTATAVAQPACPETTATGLMRCAWAASFSVTIPANAVSGFYVVRMLRTVDGYGAYVPLTVRDDRMSDLYFEAAVSTWQAYNRWHGKSLYDDDDGLAGRFAVTVTWDRPYIHDYGSGQLLRYEAPMAAYLERYGYDVSYTTNLDVTREGVNALRRHGAFLTAGHDEYWDGKERDAVEAARDNGVHLFFFGANTAYWKVRITDPGADGNARLMTCYKAIPANDPQANTPDQSGLFRGAAINRSEEKLVGTTYEEQVLFGHSWIVADGGHFAYEGTGLKTGDALPGLIGYEYDTQLDQAPPGATSPVGRSPVVDINGRPGAAAAVSYRSASGNALVFSAGSIYFPYGVDPFCATLGSCPAGNPAAPGQFRDERVERLVANLFKAALNLPVPAALSSPQAPASPHVVGAYAGSVTTVLGGLAGPSSVARLPSGDLVFADPRGNRLWRISGGAVSAFAGDGQPGGEDVGAQHFDNVPGAQARFRGPSSVWANAAGEVFVADAGNNAIRKVAADAGNTVTTIAGALRQYGTSGDNGPAINARFASPMGINGLYARNGSAVVERGLLVADPGAGKVRAIDFATGVISLLAGNPASGQAADGPGANVILNSPTSVASDDDGRVFVVVSAGFAGISVKAIGADAQHTVSTLTKGGNGLSDGSGTQAALFAQGGLLWDGSGLLIADPGNQRLRRLVPGTDAASTAVATWAGNGQARTGDGTGATASFALPLGMARNRADGTVYVADGTGSVRAVHP